MITPPIDRAAQVRAQAERRLGNGLLFLDAEFFDWFEALVREALVEHEIDVRRDEEK
jgi:hypothetical protein